MPNGMQMMLKSFGVDPEKLKEQATQILHDATTSIVSKQQEIDARLLNIERQNNRIELMLEAIIKDRGLIGIGGGLDVKHSDIAGEANGALSLHGV